jgi:hypothetical protein
MITEQIITVSITPTMQLRQHPRTQVLHKGWWSGERVWWWQMVETLVSGVVVKSELVQAWGNQDGKITHIATVTR